ncbi:RNA-binding domain-containing protein [Acinetobacter pittii]|uniref:RNA-binding domain-containing protein n=1 Tax=Acinetobacter pittii TaxID=48296 RepID=UPI003AF4CD5E
MLDNTLLNTLLNKNESPILEFKSQWYWNDGGSNNKAKEWGEFLKDFASLTNANSNYHNQKRYLIFGVKDNGQVCGTNFNEFEDERFISELRSKLENFFNFLPQFNTYMNILHGNRIFIFEIEQPKQILRVKKEFYDNKNICRENSIFVRGIGKKDDQIDIAEEFEIFSLQKNLGLTLDEITNESEEKISSRNIDTSLEYLANIKSWTLVDGYPLVLESSGKIKYKANIYIYNDDFGNKFKFLYINSFSNFKNLAIELSAIKECSKNKFIVVTDRPITDSTKRLQYIKNTLEGNGFEIQKILFLDDFGETYIYNNNLKNIEFTKFKKRNSYVESDAIIRKSNRVKGAHDIFNEWIKQVYNPILVVQGEGGIGKTTLLENYLNKFLDKNKNTKIIYMTSSNVVSKINREEYERNIDLFDFYRASVDSDTHFTRDLLRLSLDDGKILLVLDGIDEVISSLANKFNFKDFIQSIINEYSFNNGNCKIVFTCRNKFWEELNLNDNKNISIMTLQPFGTEKAEKFFQLAFPDIKKQRQAIKILNKFIRNNSNTYIPFMLDTVKYLIEKKEEDARNIASDTYYENDVLDEDFFLSNMHPLLISDSHDYLVYKICGHEFKKYKFYTIDEQLSLLTKLATDFDGSIEISKLSKIDEDIDNLKEISLREHLLLEVCSSGVGETLNFKYEFLKKHFKQINISRFILGLSDESLNVKILESMNVVGYANLFSNEILNRISTPLKQKEEEFVEFSTYLFERIKQDYSGDQRLTFSSNTFMLLIYIYMSVFVKKADEFLSKVFINDGYISNLYLKNVSTIYNSSKKIVFNFEDLRVKDSVFENFDFFWDCKFNKNTIFEYCTLRNIKNRPTSKSNISYNIFDTSEIDTSLRDAVDGLFENFGNKKMRVKRNIEKILKIFESNGNFKPQKVKKVNADVSNFNGNLILETLINLSVICKHNQSVMHEDEYIISEDFHDLIDVVVQDNSSIIMDRIVRECMK